MPGPDSPSHPAAPAVSGAVAPSAAATAGLDRATLERVRAREPEALGIFYDRYMDLVYGLASRLLGNRTLAEDATSEVFLKVHRAADRLDSARDPAPWLVTITTNVCRDLWRSSAYRASRRAADVHDPLVAASLSSGRDEPEQDAVRSERERIVQQALLELPAPLRESILLHDYQGLDHRQVADALHIAHDAARKRYSRALAALAKSLEGKLR